MTLNMHGTQYGLSQHNKIFKTLKFNWLCFKTSKCNVKWVSHICDSFSLSFGDA